MKTRAFLLKHIPEKDQDKDAYFNEFPATDDLITAHKSTYGREGGGALITNTRVLRGLAPGYIDDTRECYRQLVTRYLKTGLSPRMYGTCFLVDDPDDGEMIAQTAAIRLSAAAALTYKLAVPYVYFDAFELYDRIQSRQFISLPDGVADLPSRLSVYDLIDAAGVVHIQAHTGLSPYVQATVRGVVSRSLNKGIFVILEASTHVPHITSGGRMGEFFIDVDNPTPPLEIQR